MEVLNIDSSMNVAELNITLPPIPVPETVFPFWLEWARQYYDTATHSFNIPEGLFVTLIIVSIMGASLVVMQIIEYVLYPLFCIAREYYATWFQKKQNMLK